MITRRRMVAIDRDLTPSARERARLKRQVAIGLATGLSLRMIADLVGRSPSWVHSVKRELTRDLANS